MSLGSSASAPLFCAVSAFALFAFGGCKRGRCAREGQVTMRDVTRMAVGRGTPRTLAYSGGARAIAIEQCVGESAICIWDDDWLYCRGWASGETDDLFSSARRCSLFSLLFKCPQRRVACSI